jgi:hypothetical protein
MSLLDRLLDPFRGKAITIPPYDGAFRPNTALDHAPVVASQTQPDNLILWGYRTVFSSGAALIALEAGEFVEITVFPSPISALQPLDRHRVIVGLESGEIRLYDTEGSGRSFARFGSSRLCPTAIALLDDRTAIIAHGSDHHSPSDWRSALLQKDASGSLWTLDLESGATSRVVDGLAWPSGLVVATDGTILVSETFSHRLVQIPAGGKGNRTMVVLSRIPGYPGRLAMASGGGFWLSVFAPRNRLIEFVLQEDAFRRDMLADIPPEHWIAPTLSSGVSFLEPLQCGSVRTMGVHKPWSPSRSYGLAVRLNERFQPVASFHSRSDGSRHGLTSILDTGSAVLAAIKGADLIVDIAGSKPQ